MKTASQILLLLLLGGCVAIGGNTTRIEHEKPETFIVVFEPVAPFAPETAMELLNAFNENHPPGVRTHQYRTRVEKDMLVGLICVDSEQGRDKVVGMLEKSKRLKLVKVEQADPKKLEAHYKLGQPSLKQPRSSPGKATYSVTQVAERPALRLLTRPAEVDMDVSKTPQIIGKICSELGFSVEKGDSAPGSHTYVGESLAGVYIKIDVTAVVPGHSYIQVSADDKSPVARSLLDRFHQALANSLQ